METNAQQAVKLFSNNFNCSQAVFAVLAEKLNLAADTALKIASPFGAGIAYMQSNCGATSGVLMAIGLKYGKGLDGSDADKQKAYQLSKVFLAEFKKRHQSVYCKELLDGLDMNSPEGMARIRELDLFRTRCAKYVSDAVEIAEKILAST
jgi:C_GCAxxG_C_C family probable redox protein